MREHQVIGNRLILFTLITAFIIYNIILYTQDISKTSATTLTAQEIDGQTLWQENNCTACHQLYGLGGYLGPDLTNIISNPNKGPEYAKAFFNSGIKSMPKFEFSPDEQAALISFLTAVDQTGHYPNAKAESDFLGWVTIAYK